MKLLLGLLLIWATLANASDRVQFIDPAERLIARVKRNNAPFHEPHHRFTKRQHVDFNPNDW